SAAATTAASTARSTSTVAAASASVTAATSVAHAWEPPPAVARSPRAHRLLSGKHLAERLLRTSGERRHAEERRRHEEGGVRRLGAMRVEGGRRLSKGSQVRLAAAAEPSEAGPRRRNHPDKAHGDEKTGGPMPL